MTYSRIVSTIILQKLPLKYEFTYSCCFQDYDWSWIRRLKEICHALRWNPAWKERCATVLPLVCIRKDFENHRTATEYEDSLIFKLFCFTFCNSYGGFIYLAFIGEPVIGIECEYSCVSLLATNLTIVFCVQLVVGIISDIFLYKFQIIFLLHFFISNKGVVWRCQEALCS